MERNHHYSERINELKVLENGQYNKLEQLRFVNKLAHNTAEVKKNINSKTSEAKALADLTHEILVLLLNFYFCMNEELVHETIDKLIQYKQCFLKEKLPLVEWEEHRKKF